MKALGRASWLTAAFAAPALANFYNGTTYPMSVQQQLTTKDICPAICPTDTGLQPGDWSAIRSLEDLDKCNETMIFRTSVRFALESAERSTYIQACTVPSGFVSAKSRTPACVTSKSNQTATNVDFQVDWSNGEGSKASLTQVLTVAAQLQHAATNEGNCGATILFAKSGSAVLGLYAGAEIDRASVGQVMQEYMDYTHKREAVVPSEMSFQICGKSHDDAFKSSARIVGIYASTTGDVEAVHKALRQWTEAKCVTGLDNKDVAAGKKITFLAGDAVTAAARKKTTNLATRSLQKRAECTKYIMVQSGDTCQSLASRCGISLAAFEHFNGNGDDSFCSGLQIDTPMCCTSGAKPDLRPSKNADGSCAVYAVAADDLCYNINKKYYLKDDDLDNFNKGKTWGWAGCKKLIPGQKVCVSDGSPPMPTWVKNAVCGPQKPGTKRDGDKKLGDYNQCQINACCDIWGQCGTTDEFCTDTTIDDTPGTAANGTNGCISNCGTDIVNNGAGPSSFSQVAYFEAWNYERKCLHMDVDTVGKPYTHIHFAFGDISDGDWKVSAKGIEDQFRRLVRMRGVKRIFSLGGWAFSNEGTTNHIMRDAVKPENRQAFANNVISFVKDNGLDGIDFDWEYPGADDIPGADPGTPEDGPNYLEFLKLVRAGLGDKSISIATPASYWYLRHFPIKEMADVIDYTVFMTYDFHGQWDVDNKFVSPGCPDGNCLRSHVNKTETLNALSMVTKAGMPSNKIMVGVSSYGRSFKMAQAGCYGPTCTYLGGRNQSPAEPGKCTDTGGYIADAEINAILEDETRIVKSYWDELSDTDIVVYDDVQWVAHMTNVTKQRRRGRYQDLNFAGTSDWAVDLQGDDLNNDGGGDVVYIGTEVYTSPTMHCTAPCTIVFAPSPLGSTTTISIPKYTTSLQAGTETITVTITPTPITTDKVPFYNAPIPSDQSSSTTPVQPYPSLEVPDATVTFTYHVSSETKTSTRIVALPPWPLITNGPPPDGEDWDHPPNITSSDSSGFFVAPSNTVPPGPPPSHSSPVYSWGWQTVPGSISPMPTKPPKPECEDNCDEDDSSGLVTVDFPCDVWFFNICPNGDDDNDHGGIHGWRISFPPGRIGPGPPPPGLIKPPTGFHIDGPLPPWPPITFPKGGGSPPDEPEKPDKCETKSASMCGTTTSYGSSIAPGGAIKTTTTRSYSTCYTIYGCEVEDDESHTTTGGSCNLARRSVPTANRDSVATSVVTTSVASTASAAAYLQTSSVTRVDKHIILEEVVELSHFDDDNNERERLLARAPDTNCYTFPAIIIPKDIHNARPIETWLKQKKDAEVLADFTAVKGFAGTSDEYIAWFWVKEWPHEALRDEVARLLPEVALIYDPEDFADDVECVYSDSGFSMEEDDQFEVMNNLTKRDGSTVTNNDFANAMLSQPRNQGTLYNQKNFIDSDSYKYHLDDTEGDGQTIYMIESSLDPGYSSFEEFKGAKITKPLFVPNPYPDFGGSKAHGLAVMSVLVGQTIGTARKATLVPVLHEVPDNSAYTFSVYQALITVLDDIRSTGLPGASVVTISWTGTLDCYPEAFQKVVFQILDIYNSEDILLIASAGNRGEAYPVEVSFPQAGINIMSSGIIVGSIDRFGFVAESSSRNEDPKESVMKQIFTSGKNVMVVRPDGSLSPGSGTSYAAPRIAGLAAYLRALPSKYQDTITSGNNIKHFIRALQGYLQPKDVPQEYHSQLPGKAWAVPHAWNGQVPPDPKKPGSKSQSCILQDEIEFGENCNICPDLSHFVGAQGAKKRASVPIEKRLAACKIPGGGGGDGGGGGGSNGGGDLDGLPVPGPVMWEPGKPSPLCLSDCGKVCEGFFCSPHPTGTEPDFNDPDPDDNKPTSTSKPEPTKDPEPELDKPDPSKNTVDCYNSGQKSSYDKIDYAIQSFCRDVVSYRSTWSNDKLEEKKTPPGNYHFALMFQVFDQCVWQADYDECVRYLHIPVDSCDCSAKGDKQGGTFQNNCIAGRVDPNYGQ